ncbi:alpha/beta hydrolase fold domain-containing protein [Mariniflexile gromovii]|uniref:Alpha/beta hydrolase n=1 Tax=Mariniflexile gromovii TaxID=362523 RepID=A0ABS4BPS9_9FLAO|nr:alpha/beta hydrolase [Mariniflexile gromovii]MBP0902566.1 alpha/beta hydrolase [Mariniflexile gromovii]
MKYLNLFFFCFVLSISFFNCENETINNSNNDLNPSKTYQELNISYGNDTDQIFDLYLPANRTANTKTLILVHGGGWSSGDKVDMDPIKDLIRQDLPNLAIVNINYRLADANNNPYPMQIDDITTIINYLKTNKIKYTISDNFGFIGTSAGGHLALLWSYAFDTQNNIDMVCSIVGPTNLTDPLYLNNTNAELQAMLDLYGVNAEISFLEEVSPLHRVTATAPPTILFYGAQDPLIPTTQGTNLRDKLENLNVTHQFTLYPYGGHGWIGLDLLDTWIKLKAFTQTHL